MTARYLSHRPFLVIDTYHQPARGVRTEKRGWGSLPSNWIATEAPYVVDRITAKIMSRATVIIDLAGNKAVKNRYIDSSDEAVVAHYCGKYLAQVDGAMGVYRLRKARASQSSQSNA